MIRREEVIRREMFALLRNQDALTPSMMTNANEGCTQTGPPLPLRTVSLTQAPPPIPPRAKKAARKIEIITPAKKQAKWYSKPESAFIMAGLILVLTMVRIIKKHV